MSFEAPELDGATGEWEPGRGKQGLWEGRPVPWGLQDPAAIFQSRETLQVLQQALQALPDAQRRVSSEWVSSPTRVGGALLTASPSAP